MECGRSYSMGECGVMEFGRERSRMVIAPMLVPLPGHRKQARLGASNKSEPLYWAAYFIEAKSLYFFSSIRRPLSPITACARSASFASSHGSVTSSFT